MMKAMKRLLLVFACCGLPALATDLPAVHSVFVMPMSQGMDQFLANRLAGEHVFQVVSDPKLADAVLSDRIGASLNSSLDELTPAVKPAAAEQKDAKADSSAAKFATAGAPDPALSSSFGRGKGNFFLLDVKSRQVLWSTFALPKDSTAGQLDRTASDIVSRLMHDMKKK